MFLWFRVGSFEFSLVSCGFFPLNVLWFPLDFFYFALASFAFLLIFLRVPLICCSCLVWIEASLTSLSLL